MRHTAFHTSKRHSWRISLAVVLLLAGACGDDLGSTPSPPKPAPEPVVVTVEFEESAVTLAVAESRQAGVRLKSANGSPITNRPVAWQSSDESVARVSASGVISAQGEGTATVSATSGSARGELRVTVVRAPLTPVLSAISPAVVTAETANFTLILTGSGFLPNAWIRINGSVLHPSFVSETELRVVVGSNHILEPGQLSVRVLNPVAGGGHSQALTLTVEPHPEARPKPVLVSLSATTVAVGSGAQTLTLTGSDFVERSVVYVSGWERPTTFVNDSTLQVQLAAEDVARGRDHYVWVVTRGPGGGHSTALVLRVRPGA